MDLVNNKITEWISKGDVNKPLILKNMGLFELPPLPSNLKKLNCSFNKLKRLVNLPNSITYLDCSNNQLISLQDLPNSITYLDCSNNQLISLQDLPNSIKTLRCGNNQLISLQDLPNSLQELDCENNQLISLPPNSLLYLYCNHNKLTSLPNLPKDILYCSFNQLTSLPNLLNTLIEIKCNHNQITNLSTLPIKLTDLECNHNKLSSLPDLPNTLERLYCRDNKLSSLPTLPNRLQELDCRRNNLTTIPDSNSLQKLYFNGNPNLILTAKQQEFIKNNINNEDLIENKNKFIIFYEENIQKCFMDINQTYPIDHTKLLKWVEKKEDEILSSYTPEWKFKFNQNLQHISFQTFYEQCCKIAIELISTIQNNKFSNVYLYLPLNYINLLFILIIN